MRLPCLVLLALPLAACTAPEERSGVAYDARFGEATTMDLYLPGDGGPHPAVMLVHGGGWSSGDSGAFTGTARRLARTGYVAASINYRLVPDGAFPHAPADCLCALSFLRAHAGEYGIDPARVAILGYSAGGHLVSLIGLAAERPEIAPDCEAGPTGPPAAVIDGAGVSDMRAYGDADAIVDFMGGKSAEIPDRYDLASPLFHVAPAKPPFLIIHGGGDWIVPFEHASRLRDALRAAGGDVRLLDISGGGHLLNPEMTGDMVLGVSTDNPEAWLAVIDFLARTIGEP